jgi:hypothetical protein
MIQNFPDRCEIPEYTVPPILGQSPLRRLAEEVVGAFGAPPPFPRLRYQRGMSLLAYREYCRQQGITVPPIVLPDHLEELPAK